MRIDDIVIYALKLNEKDIHTNVIQTVATILTPLPHQNSFPHQWQFNELYTHS